MVAPALAVEPFRLDTQIIDQVGALEGRQEEVQAAVDRLRTEDNVQLWIVYVDSFSGVPAQEWADQAAQESDLGLNDMLLAVATGDRAYAYSVDQVFPLSGAELADVATTAIEPALAENDWAGAVIGATSGVSQALGGEQATPSTVTPGEPTPSGGGTGWLWFVLIGIAIVALAGFLWSRSRRSHAAPAGAAEARGEAGETPFETLSTGELSRKASQLLVETDDAVNTSEQEVGFAEAQFGATLAAPFVAAVTAAKADLAKAFQLQQKLNDSEPESEAAKREMLVEISRLADAASDRLDAESAKFDEFRDLERNAPEVLVALDQKIDATAQRVPQCQTTLAALQQTYAPAAVTSVVDNVGQSRSRLEFARETADAARTDIEAGNRGEAVSDLVATEAAWGQAVQLLDAVDRLGADLAQAGEKIRAALEETERDLAEAQALADRERALAAPAAAAAAAVELAREAAGPEGGQDPIAALRRLEEADAALEQALVGARDAQQKQARARATLEQALVAARSEIAAAEDFIAARRGAVGADARAAVAEAKRRYDQALAMQSSDAVAALQEAEAADGLAERALQTAQADATGYGLPSVGPVSAPQGGGLGGLGGALLGGILVSMARGGGMGGGGFGGSGSSGGGFLGPPSFGGRGTRLRRGGGGRF